MEPEDVLGLTEGGLNCLPGPRRELASHELLTKPIAHTPGMMLNPRERVMDRTYDP